MLVTELGTGCRQVTATRSWQDAMQNADLFLALAFIVIVQRHFHDSIACPCARTVLILIHGLDHLNMKGDAQACRRPCVAQHDIRPINTGCRE